MVPAPPPVGHQLIVCRYDQNTLWGTFTVVDELTGAVVSESSTLVNWAALGHVTASGNIVGIRYGVPEMDGGGGPAADVFDGIFSVASVDPSSGEFTVIASQLDAKLMREGRFQASSASSSDHARGSAGSRK